MRKKESKSLKDQLKTSRAQHKGEVWRSDELIKKLEIAENKIDALQKRLDLLNSMLETALKLTTR